MVSVRSQPRRAHARTARAAATLLLSGLLIAPRPAPLGGNLRAAEPGLSEGARLSAIYDTILQAQFRHARTELGHACPPAPEAACETLRAAALWWEIQQDIENRRLDPSLEAASARAIEAARRWTRGEPGRGEAWFYLAGAHAPLSQWRVFRGERLAAARDGKTIKDALERALSLNPSLQDAYFGIGLYHYYADVAPAALRLLRMLLLLPGGDRTQGLEEMLRTRERGELLKGEADYQLHFIYLWYEHQPQRALEFLRALDRRYPSNPVFLRRIALIEHEHLGDHRASAADWQTALDRAEAARVADPTASAARARVGLAEELLELNQTTQAIELVADVERRAPSAPYDIAAHASIVLGDAHARAGDAAEARAAYTRAIARASRDDPHALRTRARRALSSVTRPK